MLPISSLEVNHWISIGFGLGFLYLILKIMIRPARIVMQVIGRTIVGALILVVSNIVLGFLVDIQVAVNIITAVTVGFLGIPGVVLIIATMLLLG